MKNTSFAINLSHRERDDAFLVWETPTRIVGARLTLQEELTGDAPLWLHLSGAGCEVAWVVWPPRGAGYVRGSALSVELPARGHLKIWAVRAGGGGLLRCELQYQALPAQKKTGAERVLHAGL